MERLTEHHVNKTLGAYMACSMACTDDDFDCNNCEKLSDLVDRLAAYEDIGTPEEINRILDAYGRGLTLRTDMSERLELVKGIPTERLQELAQAEKDGRLAILPPNDPLTLSELREMDGDPIYIPKIGWRICYGVDETGGVATVKIGRTARMYDYGKTWTAYRRKPEENRNAKT